MRRLIFSVMAVCMLCGVGILAACSSSQPQQSANATTSNQSMESSVSKASTSSATPDSSNQDASSDEVENSQSISRLNPLSSESAAVGNHVGFGQYEQDGNTTNGSEEIEWRVLANEGDRVLLISEYGLDSHQFDSKSGDWESSDLRNWLNAVFVDAAFSAEERGRIDGEVFCLSADEAEELFSSNEDRLCKPTEYAIKQGIEPDKAGICSWWLRTHGTDGNPVDGDVAAIVTTPGGVFVDGQFVDSTRTAVRPAIWVYL